MKLSARPHDDLNWQIHEPPKFFEFDLGLNDPYFPLEDELYFQSLSAALTHFSKDIWPKYLGIEGVLYRGSADFSAFFSWTEKQLTNYETWKQERLINDERHLKRMFCAEAFVAYFQMLAHRLPDEMPLKIILDSKGMESPAKTLHLLSPERFEHFILQTGYTSDSNIGICFPSDQKMTEDILQQIDELLAKGPFRAVYEPLLTEQWDGLDELIIFPEGVTPQGRRKLSGFLAAGGKVVEASTLLQKFSE
jgi:hypothetical protein